MQPNTVEQTLTKSCKKCGRDDDFYVQPSTGQKVCRVCRRAGKKALRDKAKGLSEKPFAQQFAELQAKFKQATGCRVDFTITLAEKV